MKGLHKGKKMSDIKKLRISLWLLLLFPAFIIVLTELNKRILIWHIRIVDFADLIFVAPFYGIIFLSLTALVFKKRSFSFWAALGLSVIALYGHAMHLTANAVNTFSTEINNYRNLLPDDVYSLIYFFDEILGHWILYVGLFGLLGILILENKIIETKYIFMMLNGLILGLVLSVTIVESSQVVIIIPAAGWLGYCIYRKWKSYNFMVKPIFNNDAILMFSSMLLTGMFLGLAIYLLIFGSWVEPSTLY